MGMDVQRGVDFVDGLFRHQCFWFALVLLFEQELPVQVGQLC